MAFDPTGQFLAGGDINGAVKLWDITTGQLFRMLEGHHGNVNSVTFDPQGCTVASGSGDNTVKLWEVVSGRLLRTLEGHTGPVKAVSYASDGRLLASKGGLDDNSVRLWRSDTGACVAIISEPASTKSLPGLAFHPHLPRLATLGEHDTVIRIWDLDMDVLLGSQPTESVRYTTAKVVLVGDSGVGKTGLGWRLAHGEFKEHASTHGQQFWVIDELRTKRKDGTECEAVLWDLAGQHIYRPVHAIFLEDVDQALVLFDPTNRQDPLKGAEFWLQQLAAQKQLPPAVLVGARVDRGAPVLAKEDFEQFCQRYGVSGGYISTSAKEGYGIQELLEVLRQQIPWDQMTTTVTTVTFKRIKEYVLALKEQPDRRGVLVWPDELRAQLQASDAEWQFSDAEMMTAVRHLANHGYVAVLRSSAGDEYILLTPELLVDLASSIVLQADKHPRELGVLSETILLQSGYPFAELAKLERAEGQILLDAAVARFLDHNICFRETLGNETLLIFPGVIKLKRPLLDEVETIDDMSYIVRGRVENVYAALVVLLGYTQTFTRINQWQSQAQYELGKDEICGFRLIEEREGEIELVLYYSATMPDYGRTLFQGLFEKFLYQRDVDVTRFPPVLCPKGHRQERSTVVKRLRERKEFLFCEECGEKISLPDVEQPLALGEQDSRSVRRAEALARLRSAYETHLVRVKGFRRDRGAPRCYISHAPAQADWVAQLARDLREAGVYVLEDRTQIQEHDVMILVSTSGYKQTWERAAEPIAADAQLIRSRMRQSAGQQSTVIPLLLEDDTSTAQLPEVAGRRPGDFHEETRYAVNLFDLVLTLYAIPFSHPAFEPLRKSLHGQWEQTLAGLTDPLRAASRRDKPQSSIDTAEDSSQMDEILRAKQRRLRVLEKQAAQQGTACPPHIVTEIEDLREEIKQLTS